MRTNNKGLTVKVNIFSLEKHLDEWDSKTARLFIKGCVTHASTKKEIHFNDAGELISILGKWNAEKFKELKANARRKD